MNTLEEALAAIEKLTADNAAILAKNSELITREKTAKSAAEVAAQAAAEASAAAEAAAAEKTGDIEAVKAAAAKKHATDLAKVQAQLAERDAKLGELLIDNHIKSAMSANNVLAHFAPYLEAKLRAGVTLVDGEAVTPDGTPLSDATSTFFASKDAAHFVAAPANAGAGAQGNQSQNGQTWTKPPVTGEEMTAWAKAAVADPATHNAIAENWNRPDLLA